MPAIKLNPALQSLTGQVGSGPDSLVYYQVNGRVFARTRGTTNDPATTRQQVSRAALRFVSKAYKNLTVEQFNQWIDFTEQFKDHQCVEKNTQRYTVYDLFRRLNHHRFLAGEPLMMTPPALEAPGRIIIQPTIHLIDSNRLSVRFSHRWRPGEAWWRIHLSPPLDSAVRLARKEDVRSPTINARSCYFLSQAGEEEFIVESEWNYTTGETLGIKVLGLNIDLFPGEERFDARGVVES